MNGSQTGRTFPNLPVALIQFSRFCRRFPVVGTAVSVFVLLAGCEQKGATQNDQSVTSSEDNLSAIDIFSRTLTTYRNADEYSDKAVLYMSYRLNGRPIQEPQPWAIALGPQGEFAADLFNAQIRCDGRLLSCYVYDIESGNLDNQRLLLPVKENLPINELYADPIASHFITGYSEMPLDTNKAKEETHLIPPTIGLLTGLMEPNWLRPDVRLERFEDSDVDGRPCFVLRCYPSENDEGYVDLWIDKENSTIWQAAFPSDCLDAKVRSSPEITNLRIVARFHEASFEKLIPAEAFALKPRTDATPVRKFVKIPDSLPSELIGDGVPEFSLLTQSGKILESEDFKGKTTTLLWISGNAKLETIYELDQLVKDIPGERQNYGVVYSEPNRASYESDVHSMNMALHEVARNTTMPFYYDKDLATSLQFRVKSIPCLVIFDKNLRVQFARNIEGEWLKDTRAAIERINEGEDIAEEMLSEYKQFLEAYHGQLLAAGVSSAADAASRSREIDSPFDINSNGRLISNRTWTNSQFKLPGNICVAKLGNSKLTYVLDGWRTVVQLDDQGRAVNRYELDLPNEFGVSTIRTNTDSQYRMWFAAFMPQGNRVFVFDHNWKLVSTYPNDGEAAIRDVKLTNNDEMIVAFAGDRGVHKVNLRSASGDKISNQPCSSVSQLGRLGVFEGKLIDLSSGKSLSALATWQVSRIDSSENQHCCLGTSKDGNWFAIGVVPNDSVNWSASIGPQNFEHNLDSVAASDTGSAAWAIANSDGAVHLFGRDGSWLGDFETGNEITGVALVTENGRQRLLVGSKSGVTNWDLRFSQSATLPASHRNSR